MRIVLNVLVSFACLLMTTLVQPLQAQPACIERSTALITPDAIAMLTVQPSLCGEEQVHAAFATGSHLGGWPRVLWFDPLQLERIDVISFVHFLARWSAVVICCTHSQPITKDTLSRLLPVGPVSEKGVEMWPIPPISRFRARMRSPNQAIIGPKMHVLRLLKTTLVEGDLRKLVTGMDKGAALQLVVALEPLRDMLIGLGRRRNCNRFPATELESRRADSARIGHANVCRRRFHRPPTSSKETRLKTLSNCRTQSRRWFVLD